MPKIPFNQSQLPDWADPATLSVFDPLHKRAAKKTVKFLGMDEPSPPDVTDLMPNAMGVAPLGGLAAVLAKRFTRVAPMKAAKELVDVLRGTSKRIPPTAAMKPLTDSEASIAALLQSRMGGKPPLPTKLSTIPIKEFKPMTRILPRDPAVASASNSYQAFKEALSGATSRKTNQVSLPSFSKLNKDTPGVAVVARKGKGIDSVIAATARSQVTEASGIKLMTEKEMRGLIEGPRKALKLGMIPKEEAQIRIAINQQKLDNYLNKLKELDYKLYEEQMLKRIKLSEGIQ